MAKKQDIKVCILNAPETPEEWKEFGERITTMHKRAVISYLSKMDGVNINNVDQILDGLNGREIQF